MYKYLSPSVNELLVSSVIDENKREKYIFNIDNSSVEFYTEPVGFPAAHHVHYKITKESTIVGSTIASLESSIDGITWFDSKDNNGSSVTFTLDNTLTIFLFKDLYAFGSFQRWKFTGGNTGGSISVQALVK